MIRILCLVLIAGVQIQVVYLCGYEIDGFSWLCGACFWMAWSRLDENWP